MKTLHVQRWRPKWWRRLILEPISDLVNIIFHYVETITTHRHMSTCPHVALVCCWERVETSAPPSLIHHVSSCFEGLREPPNSNSSSLMHLKMHGAKRAPRRFGRVRAWLKVAGMPPFSSSPSSPYNIILDHPHLNPSNLTLQSLLEKRFSVAKFNFAISQGHHFPPFCSNSLQFHWFKASFLVSLIGWWRGEEMGKKKKEIPVDSHLKRGVNGKLNCSSSIDLHWNPRLA